MNKKMFLLALLFVFMQGFVSAYEYTPFGFYIPMWLDNPQNYRITEYNNLGTPQSVLVKKGNTLTKYDGVGRLQGYIVKQGTKLLQYDSAGNLSGYTIFNDSKTMLYDSAGRVQGWWVISQ